MAQRRILSLWFPRLAAERHLRRLGGALPQPFAVTADRNGAQVIVSLNPEAEAAGLRLDQPLRDATAMCPDLLTRPANPLAETAFLTVLRRWAGKFSPWVAEEPPHSLVIDLTGCTHLFGGEAALMAQVELDCADLGLTMRAGIADTPGAAWALARFAGQGVSPSRSGDDIMQEARATRSRAAKRRGWERGGLPPAHVQILGALPAHETVTGFQMTPFIGVVGAPPPFTPDRAEVAEVFSVPLDFLRNLDNFRIEQRHWQGQPRNYYIVPYGPYYIWGATARVLYGLAQRLSP